MKDYREEFGEYCNKYQSQCGNIDNFDCDDCEILWLKNQLQAKDKMIDEAVRNFATELIEPPDESRRG